MYWAKPPAGCVCYGSCIASGSSKLGGLGIGSELECKGSMVFMGLGKRKEGTRGGAWLVGRRSECGLSGSIREAYRPFSARMFSLPSWTNDHDRLIGQGSFPPTIAWPQFSYCSWHGWLHCCPRGAQLP
jgi:hypothetical protein